MLSRRHRDGRARWVSAATLPADFFAGHGGVAGFTKCLGYEWPEVTVRRRGRRRRDPGDRTWSSNCSRELGDPDGPFEVGRDGDRRVTWQVDPGPLAKEAHRSLNSDADSTVLITGGARGITAKVALELATRYKSRLVLVGSSPAARRGIARHRGAQRRGRDQGRAR